MADVVRALVGGLFRWALMFVWSLILAAWFVSPTRADVLAFASLTGMIALGHSIGRYGHLRCHRLTHDAHVEAELRHMIDSASE
jgi:hypothetical protein